MNCAVGSHVGFNSVWNCCISKNLKLRGSNSLCLASSFTYPSVFAFWSLQNTIPVLSGCASSQGSTCFLSSLTSMAHQSGYSCTSTPTAPVAPALPTPDGRSNLLSSGCFPRGGASEDRIAHFHCVLLLVGQSELLSCPFNLVLAFLFSIGATLNHLCSSQTSVSLYREKGGLDLWLPAHVCWWWCLPPPTYYTLRPSLIGAEWRLRNVCRMKHLAQCLFCNWKIGL